MIDHSHRLNLSCQTDSTTCEESSRGMGKDTFLWCFRSKDPFPWNAAAFPGSQGINGTLVIEYNKLTMGSRAKKKQELRYPFFDDLGTY